MTLQGVKPEHNASWLTLGFVGYPLEINYNAHELTNDTHGLHYPPFKNISVNFLA